jgi:hypothetical protein
MIAAARLFLIQFAAVVSCELILASNAYAIPATSRFWLKSRSHSGNVARAILRAKMTGRTENDHLQARGSPMNPGKSR